MYDAPSPPMRSVAAFRRQLEGFVRDHPRVAWVAAFVGLALLAYPFWGGALAARVVASQLTARLAVRVKGGRGRAGRRRVRLGGLVGGGEAPLVTVRRLEVPFAALWGKGAVIADGPRVDVRRGGPRDNVTALLARLRGRGA